MAVGFATCRVMRISHSIMVFPISIPPVREIFANLPSFPPTRAVYRAELCKAERGEAAIRRLRLWAESSDAQRASSKTRQSIGKRNLEEQPFVHLMTVPLSFGNVFGEKVTRPPTLVQSNPIYLSGLKSPACPVAHAFMR